MGYTEQEIKLVGKYVLPGMSVLECGSQNDYTTGNPKPPFISEWFKTKDISEYTSIDLAGDNLALTLDLSHPSVVVFRQVDLLTDIGFGEHIVQAEEYEMVSFHDGHINSVYPKGEKKIIEGFYNFWLNKHNLLKIGGVMVNVNPKTRNWPDHGYTYLTEEFYRGLIGYAGYSILEIGENAASGNYIDGYNIFCVLRKESDNFPTFEQFKTLDIHQL